MLQQLWSNHITDIFLHNKRFCYRYSKAKVLERVHNFVNQLFNTTLSLNSQTLFMSSVSRLHTSLKIGVFSTSCLHRLCFLLHWTTTFKTLNYETVQVSPWTSNMYNTLRWYNNVTQSMEKKSNSRCLHINKTQPINNCVRSDMSPPVTAGCIIISQTTVETEK